MKLKGKQYDMEHIVHLIREIDYLRTQIRPHDTGHIYTTISTLEDRVEELWEKRADTTLNLKSFYEGQETDSYGC